MLERAPACLGHCDHDCGPGRHAGRLFFDGDSWGLGNLKETRGKRD